MDYSGFVKSLQVPPGYVVPAELTADGLHARALSRADLEDDLRGINSGIELIRRTRGGGWPSEQITADFNFVDLVWHEAEFREGFSYSYAVYDEEGGYLGCCYLYPMGRRTALTPELIDHDVDVSWWVTPDAYERGYYTKLYQALRGWLAESFPFTRPYYSNREIPPG